MASRRESGGPNRGLRHRAARLPGASLHPCGIPSALRGGVWGSTRADAELRRLRAKGFSGLDWCHRQDGLQVVVGEMNSPAEEEVAAADEAVVQRVSDWRIEDIVDAAADE